MNGFVTQIFRGGREIQSAEPILFELARKSNQPEVLADIHYFLGKPGLLQRTPVLLLLRRAEDGSRSTAADLPLGAVLLFEYKLAGVPLGLYTSNDRSGRRAVIAAEEDRWSVATHSAEYLLGKGAHLVMLSFRGASNRADGVVAPASKPGVSWVCKQRSMPDFLALQSTFDETLKQIGKRTWTHMRYYRRRAEDQLGCTFEPELKLSEAQLLAFKRQCMYPVADPVASWRLRALEGFSEPVLMGLRERNGDLLSLLGGRRLNGGTEVFWQMNRCDLTQHSLSLVMRTYLIEHEIEHGMQRVYLDGGSAHSLCHAFVTGNVVDLAALRRTPVSFLVRKLARKLIPWDNELAHLLVDPAHGVTQPALAVE